MTVKSGRARMPWHGDISHTVLSDCRKVLRGSQEEARHKFGDEAVDELEASRAHAIETGCSRRLPCRDCDEEMRRLWYGDAHSDEDDE